MKDLRTRRVTCPEKFWWIRDWLTSRWWGSWTSGTNQDTAGFDRIWQMDAAGRSSQQGQTSAIKAPPTVTRRQWHVTDAGIYIRSQDHEGGGRGRGSPGESVIGGICSDAESLTETKTRSIIDDQHEIDVCSSKSLSVVNDRRLKGWPSGACLWAARLPLKKDRECWDNYNSNAKWSNVLEIYSGLTSSPDYTNFNL